MFTLARDGREDLGEMELTDLPNLLHYIFPISPEYEKEVYCLSLLVIFPSNERINESRSIGRDDAV